MFFFFHSGGFWSEMTRVEQTITAFQATSLFSRKMFSRLRRQGLPIFNCKFSFSTLTLNKGSLTSVYFLTFLLQLHTLTDF